MNEDLLFVLMLCGYVAAFFILAHLVGRVLGWTESND